MKNFDAILTLFYIIFIIILLENQRFTYVSVIEEITFFFLFVKKVFIDKSRVLYDATRNLD